MFQHLFRLRPNYPSPTLLFWAFALLHLFLWTLIPYLFNPNLPLDVIEGYLWGREWLMGTYKHPPMQAWVLEIMAYLTGRSPLAHLLASQLAIVTSFWAIWKLGCRLTNEKEALIGVLLLEGVIYFNLTTPEFNPNVIQLPFLSLTALSFHKAVKDNKIADWALLGVWIAGGLYCKYSFGILPALLGLFLVADPLARQRLKSFGPPLTLVLTSLLYLPHALWLQSDQFQALAYAESRAAKALSFQQNIVNTGHFIGSQFAAVLFLIVLFLFLSKGETSKRKPPNTPHSFDQNFLHLVAFGPVIVVVGLGLLFSVKLHDMWGSSLWCFSGLWCVTFLNYDLTASSLKLFRRALILVMALGLTVYASMDFFGPAVLPSGKRVHFPGQVLARKMEDYWKKTYNAPLSYAVSDMWLAGNVAYYNSAPSHKRPHVFIGASKDASPWIDDADLKAKGGVILWCGRICGDEFYAQSIPSHFSSRFPEAVVQQPLILKWQTGFETAPIIVGWAVIPPAP